jgi:uncharacterized protein (TIGR02246 family)
VADQTGDSEPVAGIIAGLMGAWNAHDMHAFAELFADDASFINVNGSWLEHPDQIEAFHRIIHNSIFKDSTAEIRPAKISVVRSDVAVVQATWQIRGDSRRSEPRDYVMTLVLRKQDEQWRILAAQNGSAEDRSSLGFTNVRTGEVASLPARAATSDPSENEDRIHAALAAFDAAWNHRDRGAMARLFAGNADFVDTAARWLHDPQLIANHIIDKEVPSLGGPTRASGVEKLTMLCSDFAVILQRWNLQPSDPSDLVRQGMGLRVVEDHGQGWQILAGEDTLIRASG